MMRRPTTRRRALHDGAAVLVSTVLVLTGCAKTQKAAFDPDPPSTIATTAPTTVASTTTTEVPLDTDEPSPENVLGYIATPIGETDVFEEPDGSSPTIDVGDSSPAGAPLTFAVVGEPTDDDDGWVRVMLPVRPNDRTGFVRRSGVDISHTDLRVFVDLEDRALRVERAGDEVARFDIAIGMDHNPTPAVPAFVTELLQPPNPNGAYGPYAFGLSIHSDQHTEFGGGDGQVGIHGTNEPHVIGTKASAGCVRLRNDDIVSLVDLAVPLGMPVFIS